MLAKAVKQSLKMIDNIRSREEKSQALLRASRYWMQKVQQPVW